MTAARIPEPVPVDARAVFGDRLATAAAYAEILCGTGVAHGLIGPNEPTRIWTRHLLNSTAAAAFIPVAAHVVDLGSGAGLPGIPLLLARPDVRMTLLEPMHRRVQFLEDTIRELHLLEQGLNVVVVRSRAQDAPAAGVRNVDVVVARAVAPLGQLAALARPLLRPQGVLLALKGVTGAVEIAEAGIAAEEATTDVLTVVVAGEPTTVVRIRWTGPPPGQHSRPRRDRRTKRGGRS